MPSWVYFTYNASMFKKKPDQNDEIVPENNGQAQVDLDDSVVAEENLANVVKKLRDDLKKCEAERLEYLTGWQRAKADLINARKRDEEDKKDFARYANEGLISEILPVLESFDMAMQNKEVWEKVDKNWRIGVEYIRSQLHKALEDNGLKEINPINEKFDHSKHEAVAYESVSDPSYDHVIVGVVQKGYSLNEKVMKVPKVKVGEFRKS